MSEAVYICAAYRTPVGKAKGVFANKRPDDLLSDVISGLLKSVESFDPQVLGDVVIGCAMPEAEQGMNVARIASLLAGVPEHVPAMTINRFCSSGLQSIALAANRIAMGEIDAALAGGVESMSLVPMGGHKFVANPRYTDLASDHIGVSYSMGITAEHVAQAWHIDRAAQDAFALRSHERAVAAQRDGRFTDEIIPVQVEKIVWQNATEFETVQQTIEADQGPRKDTSLDALSKLRPVFRADGTVTAGNTSQMSDGAACLLLVNEETLQRFDLTPLARLKAFCVAGVDPKIMGIGPIAAAPKAVRQADITFSDVSWIELNEAFAAQSLAVIQELELDPDKVNPLGGAIALGHPLGATGAIKAATLIHGLKREEKRYGMVTMCIGTGMGAAGVFESL